jgi:hypothetical protein
MLRRPTVDDGFIDRRVSVLLRSPAEFITIPNEDWSQPEWINETKAEAGRNKLVEESVIYGGSISYVDSGYLTCSLSHVLEGTVICVDSTPDSSISKLLSKSIDGIGVLSTSLECISSILG